MTLMSAIGVIASLVAASFMTGRLVRVLPQMFCTSSLRMKSMNSLALSMFFAPLMMVAEAGRKTVPSFM